MVNVYNVGSATGAFQFIKEVGYIPFETCQPYLACSSDSTEEFCKHIDNTCSPLNICKTCTRRSDGVGECNQVCNENDIMIPLTRYIVNSSFWEYFMVLVLRFHNFHMHKVRARRVV